LKSRELCRYADDPVDEGKKIPSICAGTGIEGSGTGEWRWSTNSRSSSHVRALWRSDGFVDTEKASLIHDDPRPVRADANKPLSSKSVQACPAVNDFESRYFEIS